MKQLMKLVFFRAFKAKQFIIYLIIGFISALIVPLFLTLIYTTLESSVTPLFEDFSSLLLSNFSVSYMSSGFSLGPLVFLMFGMGMVHFLNSEARSGAIRNQITAGYSRTKIYYSYYLTLMIILFLSLVSIEIVTLGIGSITSPVGDTLKDGEFWARLLISFVILFANFTLVFSFSIRFEAIAFPILVVSLFIPLVYTLGSVIPLATFTTAMAKTDGSMEALNALTEQYKNVLSWIPMTQFQIIQAPYDPVTGSFDLLGMPYLILDNALLIKAGVMNSLYFAIALVTGQLLYSRKEFK